MSAHQCHALEPHAGMDARRMHWPRALALLLALLLAAAGAARRWPTTWPPSWSPEGPAAPGKPVTVAIHFTPEKGWHGYWKNPGDAGYGMDLAWHLPPGWSAGEPHYPVPQTLEIAGLMNHVYESDYAVLVPLNVPAGAGAGADPDRGRGRLARLHRPDLRAREGDADTAVIPAAGAARSALRQVARGDPARCSTERAAFALTPSAAAPRDPAAGLARAATIRTCSSHADAADRLRRAAGVQPRRRHAGRRDPAQGPGAERRQRQRHPQARRQRAGRALRRGAGRGAERRRRRLKAARRAQLAPLWVLARRWRCSAGWCST